MQINDERTKAQKKATALYVVATDRFMSGWGEALGNSYFAVAVPSLARANDVERRFRQRSEFKYIRINKHLPRGGKKDHLSVSWDTSFQYGLV